MTRSARKRWWMPVAMVPLILSAVIVPSRAQDVSAAIQASEAAALADLAFARDDYAAAETYYRQAIAANPGDAHALARLGLLLSWRGEYAESIDLYEKALSADPSRFAAERGLATVYTWAEQYDKALALYDRLLSKRPGDEAITYEMAQAQAWSGDLEGAERTLQGMIQRSPRNLKARLLLGQVHSWGGEFSEAERIQRSVLAEDPGNLAAMTSLADTLASQGKYDEARQWYDRVLAADPKHRKALEGRARALHQEGRSPEALAAIREALELYPDARDARRLGREIGGPLRPTLQLFAWTAQDTDDNDLAVWGGTYKHFTGAKGYLGATFTHAQTDAKIDQDPGGAPIVSTTPVAKYNTLRVIAARYFQRASLYGELGSERTSFPLDIFGANTAETRQHPAGSLTLEVDAASWLTLVGTVSSERLVATTQAFMNDIGVRAATLTALFKPHRSLRVRLTGQRALFTDDNDHDVDQFFITGPDLGDDNKRDRDLALAGISWTLPWRRPRIALGYRLRWMSYEENLDATGAPIRHGYFDPDHYVSNVAGVDLSDTIGEVFYWGAGADAGWQRVNDRDDDSVFAYRLLAGLNVGEAASVEAYYSRSDHAVQSATGFRYTEAGVRLRLRFGGSLGPAAPDRAERRQQDNEND